jgi:hypothetical protein
VGSRERYRPESLPVGIGVEQLVTVRRPECRERHGEGHLSLLDQTWRTARRRRREARGEKRGGRHLPPSSTPAVRRHQPARRSARGGSQRARTSPGEIP